MNELKIFEKKEFGVVRAIEIDGKPFFVAKDVAVSLGYKNPNKAINDHCKEVTKRYLIDSMGRKQEANFISQGDVYRLAAKSELEGAEEFESWIFDEVLPDIQNHGAYMTPETLEAALCNPDTIIQIATALKRRAIKAQGIGSGKRNTVSNNCGIKTKGRLHRLDTKK